MELIFGLIAGALITLAIMTTIFKFHNLENAIADLERRVSDLEARDGKRQPYPTDDAFLDLAANAIDLLFDLDEEEGRTYTKKRKLNRMLDIIGEARQGPRSYKGDHREKNPD